MRLRTMVLVAGLLTVGAAAGADDLLLVIDNSYSMLLSDGSKTRKDIVLGELSDWIATVPAESRFTTYIADYSDTVIPLGGLTGQEALSAALDAQPWGSVDLIGALRSAFEHSGLPPQTETIVATDGEAPHLLARNSDSRLPPGHRIRYVGPGALQQNRARDESAIALAEIGTAPSFASHEIDASAVGPAASSVGPSTSEPRRRWLPSIREWSGTRVWARVGVFAFPLGVLLGLVAVLQAHHRQRDRERRVREYNDAPPAIELDLRGPDGRSEQSVRSYPVSPIPGMTLEARRIQTSSRKPTTEIWMTASQPVRVNGMPRTDAQIGERDTLRIGNTKVIVTRMERRKRLRPPRDRSRSYLVAPGLSALAALFAFLLPASPASSPTQAATSPPVHRESPGAVPVMPTKDAGVHELPTVVSVGDGVPSIDLDYLLIHAHPDDETIDFGALVARLNGSGKVGAILLLTDGSSGRDQYPWRPTGENYPPWDLQGSELAAVRVVEARDAIGLLGSSFYLRVGLENHPYNSIVEELSPGDVIRIWDDSVPVLDTLVRAIRALKPEIVLSPDVPGFAREHFEHDATGTLVARAVARVSADPDSSILAHIRAIDPYQTDGYSDLTRVPAWEPSEDGTIPRIVQINALLAHRTQRDATVIALEDRLPLDFDVIRATLFTSPAAFADWLGPGLARSLSAALPRG